MPSTEWEILQSVPDALLVINSAATIVFGNRPAERMLGYDQDQLRGMPVTELIPASDASERCTPFASFFEQPNDGLTEAENHQRVIRRDGRELPVDIGLSTFEVGEDRLVIARVRDISDREEWTETLCQSAELNLAILSSLEDHIAVLDRKGMVTAVNDAWIRFARDNGGDPPEGVGPSVNYLDVCRIAAAQGDRTAARALAGIQSVLDGTQSSFSMDYDCDSPDTERCYRLRVLPLSSPDGGAVVSHTDVTSQKRAEIELQKTLQDLQTLKERLAAENVYLREEINDAHDFGQIVGHSDIVQVMRERMRHVAATDANVLILGETGTGKELVARGIHHLSGRRKQPFVKVDCAALPASLLESELFGHVKGAFTGAVSSRTGRFELARDGSIFLDEIGELSLELQTKLLRVLQEGEFERLGSSTTVRVNVRVIAATNRNLQRAMREGEFRPDLYYRLAVFPIEVPPLREHRADIPVLIWHFITRHQAHLGKRIQHIADSTMEALIDYDWPGNVRELENYVERSLILSKGPAFQLVDFVSSPGALDLPTQSVTQLQSAKRALYVRTLEQCQWKVKGRGNAAERLGLKPSTLRYQLKKMGISRPSRQ